MEATQPLATQPRQTSLPTPALLTLPLALLLWTVAFAWQPLNFWVLMGISTVVLGTVSVLLGAHPFKQRLQLSDVLLGIASAAVLYGVFWVGEKISSAILPFASSQVGDIYGLKDQASAVRIGLLLALVVAPGEELYWRGLLQSSFTKRWGVLAGALAAISAYAAVHLVAGNLMIIVAAGVAGAVWVAMYAWQQRLWPVIISHILWDLAVFIWFPIT
jgi:hypothetical protein